MHALRICELWKGAEEHRFASLLSLCLSPPPLCVLLQLLLRHSSEWVLRRASVGPNTHYTSWRHIVFLPLRSSYFHRTRSGLHFCILRTHTSEEQMEVRATEIFSAFFIASVCWMLIISDAFVSVPTRRRHLPRMLFAFAMLVCVLRTYFNEYRAPRFFSFSTTLRDQLVFTTFESNANCKQSVEAKLNGCWWRADAVCGCMRNMFVFRFALPIFYRGFQRDNDALRFAELKCWTANGERGIILIWCACEWVREWRTVPFDKHTTIAFWVRSNRWP